jgi:hypothetical protein
LTAALAGFAGTVAALAEIIHRVVHGGSFVWLVGFDGHRVSDGRIVSARDARELKETAELLERTG